MTYFERLLAAPLLGLLTCLCTSGCVNNSYPTGPDGRHQAVDGMSNRGGMLPVVTSSRQRTYLLQPGDQFDVKFFYSAELNENAIVRPDGRVSLQLVGEVQAAGSTPAELENTLRDRYRKVLRDPAVTVLVRQFGAQRVFVGGEVKAPGEVLLQGDMTVLQAIARAGFFTRDAEARNVVVLRYKGENGPEFFSLDLKNLIDGEDRMPFWGGAVGSASTAAVSAFPVADLALEPMDVIFVPQSTIASVADFFNRYVNNILPLWRNLGFSAVYYTNTAKVTNLGLQGTATPVVGGNPTSAAR